MMRTVFYPMNHDFLTNHNGACITNYWANWDLCNMASIMAIGILTDNAAKYDQAVTYFKSGAGNGSIAHAVPTIPPPAMATSKLRMSCGFRNRTDRVRRGSGRLPR